MQPFSFLAREAARDEASAAAPGKEARLLRNRYSAFDLAHELGREGELLEAIAPA